MVVRGLPLFLAALALLTTGACADSPDEARRAAADIAGMEGRLQVVTTVAPITSIVANIVGAEADVRGVIPEGTNSHTFDPPPSVAAVLSSADVIFVNGLQLEDPTLDLAEKAGGSGHIVALGDRVLPESDYIYDFSFPKSEGRPNPHLWTDPTYAKKYAEVVRETVADLDPDNADSYATNYEAFAARVDALDEAMRSAFATVAPEQRKLVTYHDAYAYFARSYGWTVVGAIQVESFEEPSAREVAALIDQVKATGVRAIFGSEVFPSPVLAQIGKEAGVAYVDVLRDDDLPGEPGDDGHSWLGLMRFDYMTMVEALGGDASALEALDVADVAPDEAEYPQ